MADPRARPADVTNDPRRSCRFRLEIGGRSIATFSAVAIGATTTDVIDYREGNDSMHVRKLPGLIRYGNVTLMRPHAGGHHRHQ